MNTSKHMLKQFPHKKIVKFSFYWKLFLRLFIYDTIEKQQKCNKGMSSTIAQEKSL